MTARAPRASSRPIEPSPAMRPPAWVGEVRAVTFDFGNTLVPVAHEDLRRVVALTVETVLGARANAASAARKISGRGLIVPTRCETTIASRNGAHPATST